MYFSLFSFVFCEENSSNWIQVTVIPGSSFLLYFLLYIYSHIAFMHLIFILSVCHLGIFPIEPYPLSLSCHIEG